MTGEDTIVALSTPPGRGGIGVVRVSGEWAIEISTGLVRCLKLPLETQRATLGTFCDPATGRALDRVVVTCFRRPHSYTGEDVVELSCHGAPVLLRYLVECCVERGARAAEPGEFTLRAFLNGRIDLTQAEAVRDLIESQTLYQARVAATQLEGAVSARLKPHKQVLLELIAKLEAGIDFAEDDVPVMDWPELLARLDGIRTDLDKLVAGYAYGRIIRAGLSLAIVGRPNVGKSSLFNRLLNEDRAIVTATPGTTRDLVAESASIGGIPLRFVDTAGIREATEEAERIGVEKAAQAIADSDLRLLVVDISQDWTDEDMNLLQRVRSLGPLLVAANKSDLPARVLPRDLESLLSDSAIAGRLTDRGDLRPANGGHKASLPELSPAGVGVDFRGDPRVQVVWTSALTGDGVPQLREKILEVAAPAHEQGGEFITNLRHQQLLTDSLAALARARQATQQRTPHEMLLLDLYDALRALDAITGVTYVEDVLGIIFSTFCVGK